MDETNRLLKSIRSGVAFIAAFITFSFVASVIATAFFLIVYPSSYLTGCVMAVIGGIIAGLIVHSNLTSDEPSSGAMGAETY